MDCFGRQGRQILFLVLLIFLISVHISQAEDIPTIIYEDESLSVGVCYGAIDWLSDSKATIRADIFIKGEERCFTSQEYLVNTQDETLLLLKNTFVYKGKETKMRVGAKYKLGDVPYIDQIYLFTLNSKN